MKTRAELGTSVTYKNNNNNKEGEKAVVVNLNVFIESTGWFFFFFSFFFGGGRWGINYKDGKRVYNNGSNIMIIKYLNSFFLTNFEFFT